MTDTLPSPVAPVLFVEDDAELRRAITEALELADLAVLPCPDAERGLASLTPDFPGVVVSDIRMEGMDGLELFARIRAIDPEIPVILISGHADIPMAVQALQDGAFDFLTKPFPLERLVGAVGQALETRRSVMENRALRAATATLINTDSPLIGDSPVMVRLRETISHVAKADLDVLIEGETGTGKELVALLLHRLGRRRGRPFVAVNCGALPSELIEAELFGAEAGAYTGANKAREGKFEAADGGTLFLDEIGNLSLGGQMKLLRVLETGRFERLGSNRERQVKVRVVSATNADLPAMIRDGTFREDLYYRLNTVELVLPPLAERPGDIVPLAERFLTAGKPLSTAATAALQRHPWPGNVRELRNVVERTVVMCKPDGNVHKLLIKNLGMHCVPDEGEYHVSQGPGDGFQIPFDLPLKQALEQFEDYYVAGVLERGDGGLSDAAKTLDIHRTTLYRKQRTLKPSQKG